MLHPPPPTHQVCAEHEEADEVDVGQVAAAAELLPRLRVRVGVTASPGQRRQHDLLPLLTCGTPAGHTAGGTLTQAGFTY